MFEISEKVWFLGAAVRSGDIVSINMLRNVAFVMVDDDGWGKSELRRMEIYRNNIQVLFDKKDDAYKAFMALMHSPVHPVKPTVYVSGVDMSYAKEKKVSWISLT